MKDHGFIALGKYSSARDSILHFLCAAEWSNDSFGDVEAPTGYVWKISNDPSDVAMVNNEFLSVLADWFTDNSEVTDSPELRAELVGNFLVTEDSQGFVSVEQYTSEFSLAHAFNTEQEQYSEWAGSEDD